MEQHSGMIADGCVQPNHVPIWDIRFASLSHQNYPWHQQLVPAAVQLLNKMSWMSWVCLPIPLYRNCTGFLDYHRSEQLDPLYFLQFGNDFPLPTATTEARTSDVNDGDQNSPHHLAEMSVTAADEHLAGEIDPDCTKRESRDANSEQTSNHIRPDDWELKDEGLHQTPVYPQDNQVVNYGPFVDDTTFDRFCGEISPNGSLLLEDCLLGLSVFLASDQKVCAFFHPLANVLLCNEKIHVMAGLSDGQHRFAELDKRFIRFTGRASAAHQTTVGYSLDNSGVKTAVHRFALLGDLSARNMFERKCEEEIHFYDGEPGHSAAQHFPDTRYGPPTFDENSFYLSDDQNVTLKIKQKTFSMKAPGLYICASQSSQHEGHIFIRRTVQAEPKLTQSIFYDCKWLKMRHNAQAAFLNPAGELVLSR